MALKRYPTRTSRAIYECDICGATGPWSEHWSWYGSLRQLDESDATTIVTVCSEKCRKKHQLNGE